MVDQKQRFAPVSSRVNFPDLEEEILAKWREEDTFHKVDEVRDGAPLFIFYEGPPTANGSPGIHHVLSRAFKDVIIRFHTMRGERPLRRGGWDTHGLPVELEVEKALGLSSKREIEAFGIEEFNRRCRESVFRYVKDWERMTERAGVWLDTKNAYVTYDKSYIETAWWVFKQLWDRDLMYEGFRVTPHCPRCVTSLSSHEVALGYKEDTPDPSVYVRFPLADAHDADPAVLARLGYVDGAWSGVRPSLMIWTTTPWTLTANTAAAVNPNEAYALAESESGAERILMARSLVESVLGDGWTVREPFVGNELIGLAYQPPFRTPGLESITHRVYPADYVTTEEGTGFVHQCPAYGAEDAEVGRSFGLPTVHTVDLHGILLESFPGGGKFFKQADRDLIRDLRERGLLYKDGTIRHTYPFCWRCDTPLLYYAKASWYIRTTAVKDRMVAGNQGINWYPEHIKEGRFGEWLRNNIDWAVSRERYWGTPLPIWRCASCGPDADTCVGSVDELARLATPETKGLVDGLDLHRPYVDRVEIACTKCGNAMQRVPEVADAWYDSGIMPFAQWQYPVTLPAPTGGTVTINNVDELLTSPYFPANYITEAIDQTRGWFYSLLATSTLIAGRPSYENVICLGLILDEKGEKMSKSRGNVVNPWDVLHDQGADALRWYLYTAAPAGSARRFSSTLVQESLRRFMLTLWNTYSFFTTYANIDGFDPDDCRDYWRGEVGGPSLAQAPPNELDRWIVSELNELVEKVTDELEHYSPTDAGRLIDEFVDRLSNWYVRRSRRRFWKAEDDDDKTWAHVTLYSCLVTLSKLMAPLTPFVADHIYRNLTPSGAPDSVHLADWPKADAALVDDRLDRAIRLAMRIASLGRAARSKAKVKVRQPLARVLVRLRADEAELLPLIESQVLDELNVKAVELADEATLGTIRIRPNLPRLGPRFGQQMGAIRQGLAAANPSDVARQVRSGGTVSVGGFELEADDVLVDVEEAPGLAVAMEGVGGLMVGIDTTLTPELEMEGFARELVHRIQNARKSAGLEIDDRITLYVATADAAAKAAIAAHDATIRQETLALEVINAPPPADAYTEQQDIDGVGVTLGIAKAV